jgi:phosphoribosyl 1,2-cyclic phosphate phosphodiesterase
MSRIKLTNIHYGYILFLTGAGFGLVTLKPLEFKMQDTENLQLLFLGTGAADWDKPEPSGEFRRYSSMIAGGDLLFDCPASVPDALGEQNIPLTAVKHLFITHSHCDHFNIEAIKSINAMRINESLAPLSVFAHIAVAEYLRKNGIEATGILPGQSFCAGDYRVISLPANHTPGLKDETALHYLVSGKGVRWLYATDGAWMPYAAWDILRSQRLDALIIDATIGDNHEGDFRIFEHNSLPMLRIMIATMQDLKILKSSSPVILTHLARTLHPDHQSLVKSLSVPFIAAYDGMVYSVSLC